MSNTELMFVNYIHFFFFSLLASPGPAVTANLMHLQTAHLTIADPQIL